MSSPPRPASAAPVCPGAPGRKSVKSNRILDPASRRRLFDNYQAVPLVTTEVEHDEKLDEDQPEAKRVKGSK